MNKRIRNPIVLLFLIFATSAASPLALAQRDIGVGEVNVQRDVVPVVEGTGDRDGRRCADGGEGYSVPPQGGAGEWPRPLQVSLANCGRVCEKALSD